MFIIFLKSRHTGTLAIELAIKEQSKIFKEWSDINKGQKPVNKKSFLRNVEFLLDVRENFVNSSESDIFPIKTLVKIQILEPKPDPTHESTGFNTPKSTIKNLSKKYIHLNYMKTI